MKLVVLLPKPLWTKSGHPPLSLVVRGDKQANRKLWVAMPVFLVVVGDESSHFGGAGGRVGWGGGVGTAPYKALVSNSSQTHGRNRFVLMSEVACNGHKLSWK